MTVTIIILILGLIIIGYSFMIYKVRKTPMADNHEKILVLDDNNFDEIIKNKTILVDFWADWCMPCKMIAPTLNELAEELPPDKFIGKVDVEKNPGLSASFRIRGIPTLIIFKNGNEIERIMGIKSKGMLKSKLLDS